MKKEHLKFLACPECGSPLEMADAHENPDGQIESGRLTCGKCETDYPVIRFIPRFVPLTNYASSFGLEWSKHARTQYDSYAGSNVSEKRFFEETKWPRDLTGQTILEVGCGSGRFTEQAVSTGAMVISLDYSYAVEANYASNGWRDNVLIVQADIYKMPFPANFFDKLFCFGVLQHTPDVKRAFSVLPGFLKSGGSLAVDVYRIRPFFKQILKTKYLLRPLTKRMKPEFLYRLTSNYVRLMWPLARRINRFRYGKVLMWVLLIADYRDKYDLEEEILKEWAILDIFDMLSPAYDSPQTMDTMKQWFEENKLNNIDICYGYNGIEGRAEKP